MSIRIPGSARNDRDQFQATSIDELRKHVIARLKSLMNRLSDTDRAVDELDSLRAMIESLPLTTGEFGVATNRLRNARRYLVSDEIGAAKYELRLLFGCL